MRSAYGDGTALIFQLSAVIAVVALIAVLFIKERPLRRTIDIKPTTASPVEPGMVGGAGPATTGALPVAGGAGPADSGQSIAAAGGQRRK